MEKKQKTIQGFERDQQQMAQENNALADQLFKLKTQNLRTADTDNKGQVGLFAESLSEQDQMVELLKRNHDAMMHKYETYR